jgi:CheY-like chemotaxis protein
LGKAAVELMNILLVEDNAELRGLLEERLTNSGYQVVTASDGQQAWALLHEHAFDMLISDILMPEKDGLEVIEEFRRVFPGKLIVAISGGSDLLRGSLCLDLARRMGADAVLTKPFTIPQLLQVIEPEQLKNAL